MDRYNCEHCCSLLDGQLATGRVQGGDGCVSVQASEGPQHLVDKDLELGIVIVSEGCAVPTSSLFVAVTRT